MTDYIGQWPEHADFANPCEFPLPENYRERASILDCVVCIGAWTIVPVVWAIVFGVVFRLIWGW